MGMLHYGAGHSIDMDDLLLAHLKMVIVTKLRRNESFTVSWTHSQDATQGRNTIWLHPSIPLRFVFNSPEPARLSQKWLEQMAVSSHSTGGLKIDLDQTEPA